MSSRISFDGSSSGSTPTATPAATTTPMAPMPVSVSPTATALVPSQVTLPTQPLTPPTKRLTQDEVDQYGKTAIASVGNVTDGILKASRAGDMDIIGQNLGNLLIEAGKFDPKHLSKGGGLIGGLLSFGKTEIQKMRNNFDSIYGLVEQLARKTEGDIKLFSGRIVDLKNLYEATKQSYYQMVKERQELEQRIAQEEAFPPEHDPADPFSANSYQEWQNTISSAHKRVHELALQENLAQQTGLQVVMMAANARALVKKFGEVLDTTLPGLKTQFSLAVWNVEQAKGAKSATLIDDFNNEIIRKNAEMLGKNTTDIQTALARNSVDLATLQFSQDKIIDAFNETKRIHAEMAERIKSERPQLEAMSQQLVQLQTSRS
jgi:uncharacterized protein YaaN involved in tellurite resistance